MLHKVGSMRDFGRKVSPPQPTYMTDDQKADYLSSLRNDRPARPSGSRPPPFKSSTYSSPPKQQLLPRSESAMCVTSRSSTTNLKPADLPPRSASALSDHSLADPIPTLTRRAQGRPLVQGPTYNDQFITGRKVSPTGTVQSTTSVNRPIYRESGTRRMERQEAHALREALEVMDRQLEEKKLHAAARDEAAELVWKHQNPRQAEKEKFMAFRNPDLAANSRFKAHLQKGAHLRSQSDAYSGLGRGVVKSEPTRLTSDGSNYSQASGSSGDASGDKESKSKRNSFVDVLPTLRKISGSRRPSSGRRISSNGSNKIAFPNAEDKIYEEPEDTVKADDTPHVHFDTDRQPLQSRTRNSLPRGARPLLAKATSLPAFEKQTPSHVDHFRNRLSQSRNDVSTLPVIEVTPEIDTPRMKDRMEVRSDDIRAATSKRRSDRSPKLPSPSAVSDRPERPIVSFDPAWETEREKEAESEQTPARPNSVVPAVTISVPNVPTINLPDDDCSVPKIILPDDEVTAFPQIILPGQNDTPSISTPVVNTTKTESAPRPLPHHSQTSPAKLPPSKPTSTSRLPWLTPTRTNSTPTATCTACSLPISGRIVTATGSSTASKARFHPECFTCHHCSTPLEHVSFYPEPASSTASSDDDELRFYCHLDYHELFSPRCRTCSTPIEGTLITAIGHTYHPEHFFCAECGDPFASDTPFVEKDSYAYCLSCHTKRISVRCRGCKGQILDDMTVEALGGTWHGECFVCWECTTPLGGDEQEGRFFVRDVQVEGTEKEKRRGVLVKMEERAVCVGCEGRRLKA